MAPMADKDEIGYEKPPCRDGPGARMPIRTVDWVSPIASPSRELDVNRSTSGSTCSTCFCCGPTRTGPSRTSW